MASRVKLFKSDPHCFWCGRLTSIEVAVSADEFATIDHLYSRFHPARAAGRGSDRNELLHVLSCRKCNLERAVAEQSFKTFVPKLRSRIATAVKYCATISRKQLQKEPQPVKRDTVEEPVKVESQNSHWQVKRLVKKDGLNSPE